MVKTSSNLNLESTDPRWDLVRELLRLRIDRPKIINMLMKRFGWSQSYCYRFVKATLDKMEAERFEFQPYDKVQAIESIRSLIEKSQKKDDLKIALGAEALLSKIQGTLEPTRLEINVHEERRQALFEYLDSFSEEESEAQLKEYELIDKKAEFFDQGRSCRDVSPEELGIECKVLKLPIKG